MSHLHLIRHWENYAYQCLLLGRQYLFRYAYEAWRCQHIINQGPRARWPHRLSSDINATHNFRISLSLLPLGSKSQPPFPPPIISPVRAFLNVCSKPRNLRMERLTVGWNRRPPLYGPRAELNCYDVRNKDSDSTDCARKEKTSYLDTVASVDLNLAFVVFPNNAELDDALRDLLRVTVG
jgi:hypothetical protein